MAEPLQLLTEMHAPVKSCRRNRTTAGNENAKPSAQAMQLAVPQLFRTQPTTSRAALKAAIRKSFISFPKFESILRLLGCESP
jgi:hypothetical protein